VCGTFTALNTDIMLQVNTIRDNTAQVLQGLNKRGLKNATQLVEEVVQLDQNRKDTQKKADDLKAKSNTESKKIGEMMKSGQQAEATQLRAQVAADKDAIKALETELASIEERLTKALYLIPNVPHEKVPAGLTPEQNLNVHQHGTIPTLGADALPHWELIKKFDIIDFELGIKIAGAGFPVYKGKGAKLQRALINFFLDEAAAMGYRGAHHQFISGYDFIRCRVAD
jgi:seryl-tRNA synthetase